jgi:hypothetical protein
VRSTVTRFPRPRSASASGLDDHEQGGAIDGDVRGAGETSHGASAASTALASTNRADAIDCCEQCGAIERDRGDE